VANNQISTVTLSDVSDRHNILSSSNNHQTSGLVYRWDGGNIQKKLERAFNIKNHDGTPANKDELLHAREAFGLARYQDRGQVNGRGTDKRTHGATLGVTGRKVQELGNRLLGGLYEGQSLVGAEERNGNIDPQTGTLFRREGISEHTKRGIHGIATDRQKTDEVVDKLYLGGILRDGIDRRGGNRNGSNEYQEIFNAIRLSSFRMTAAPRGDQ
jgi:hypothetical protein